MTFARLRQLAVTVIEPRENLFQWQILENLCRDGATDDWYVVKQGSGGRAEWIDAFNDGVDEVFI